MKAQVLGLVALVICVILYLLNVVDVVPIILAVTGMISLWMMRIEHITGERLYFYTMLKLTYGEDIWTFRIGNNITEMNRKKATELLNMLKRSLQSDVGLDKHDNNNR